MRPRLLGQMLAKREAVYIEGPFRDLNRAQVRYLEAGARREDRPAAHKPKNWTRDRHKRRKEQRRRRKQSWNGA